MVHGDTMSSRDISHEDTGLIFPHAQAISAENEPLLLASSDDSTRRVITEPPPVTRINNTHRQQDAVHTRLLHALPSQFSAWLQAAQPTATSQNSRSHQRRQASMTDIRDTNIHSIPSTEIAQPEDPSSRRRGVDIPRIVQELHPRAISPAQTNGIISTPTLLDMHIDTESAQHPGGNDVSNSDHSPTSPPSQATSPRSTTSSDDDTSSQSSQQISTLDEFQTLFRRSHHSLPFIALFVLYFAFQHAVGILVFIVGSVAIAGLDQRVRTQIALKENASSLRLWGVIAMCLVDAVALSAVAGDAKPWSHLGRKLTATEDNNGLLFLQVAWLVLVNDFIIRLGSLAVKAAVALIHSELLLCGCRRPVTVSGAPGVVSPSFDDQQEEEGKRRKAARSNVSFYRRKRKLFGIIELVSIFLRSLLAGVPWCSYYQLCGSKFMADVFTFIYIFGKGLILATQGRHLFKLVQSFVTLGLEHATYVTRDELVEAGCPDCSICYETMHVPVKLSCSHMFCEECVMEWFDRERSCPLCRAAVATTSSRGENELKPQFLDGSTSLYPQMF